MSGFSDQELRASFGDTSDARPGEHCPSADSLWRGAHGELAAAELEPILDHLVSCAACTEAWCLALELREQPIDELARRRRRNRILGAAGALAAAAVILVMITRGSAPSPDGGGSRYRGTSGAPAALIEDGQTLSRDQFTLRWSATDSADRYRVRLMTETLDPIYRADDLRATELTVPADALAELPDGSRLLWQVTAVSPDGRAGVSPTFAVRVGR